MISAFLYGITLAIGLIIPLGMQNVFIFNQGATQPHFTRALPSVFTAFICDVLLILCAVLGISLVVLTIPILKNVIFGIGIIFLSYMGFVTWNNSSNVSSKAVPLSVKKQIGFSISVSLLNPHAIIDTIAVIGTNSLNFNGYNKFAFTFACMFVSLCWFLGLSISGHYLNKLDRSGVCVALVNKLSAIIIWGIALYLAWRFYLMN